MNGNPSIQPIKIALLAVGGDGGSVLTNWIIALAEANDYWAQSTSIAGVAQRTGATVYYLELVNKKTLPLEHGKVQTPVLAQMPAPFDVDIVMATEIMEAGRALARNFISKKTTVIYSTNRNLAIREKEIPGDGIHDGKSINALVEKYAQQSLYGNLKIIAEKNKSVISASMFGALAASGTLPFDKKAFITTIEKGGIAVSSSTAAFNESYDYIKQLKLQAEKYTPTLKKSSLLSLPEEVSSVKLQKLVDRIRNEFPPVLHPVLYTGVVHLSDWQNTHWATVYLDKLDTILQKDWADEAFTLTRAVAQNLAIGMSFDDLIFVADQKTRAERTQEVYQQIEAKPGEIVHTLDYLHPSFDEFVGFLPRRMGLKIARSKKWKSFFDRRLDRDRRMKSTGFFNFILLYFLGGMKRWRMKTFRHFEEMGYVSQWLDQISEIVSHNYLLAVQVAQSYRQKKGYGATYRRGHSKFHALCQFALVHQHKPKVEVYMEHLLQCALQEHEFLALKKKIDEVSLLL